MKNPKCSVVVMSCDSHDDIADISARMFRKFWQDCPFETILVNELSADVGGFDRIATPGKLAWSKRLKTVLDGISSPYVLLLCDDYLISDYVDGERVLKRLADAERLDTLNLRLATSSASLGYLRPFAGTEFLEYPKDKPYCIATQPGLWNREGLLRIVSKTDSAWDFERSGSLLSRNDSRPILSTAACEFRYLDAVRRGLWFPPAVSFCRKEGVAIDLNRRQQQPFSTRAAWAVRDRVYAVAPRFFTALSTWWTKMV